MCKISYCVAITYGFFQYGRRRRLGNRHQPKFGLLSWARGKIHRYTFAPSRMIRPRMARQPECRANMDSSHQAAPIRCSRATSELA